MPPLHGTRREARTSTHEPWKKAALPLHKMRAQIHDRLAEDALSPKRRHARCEALQVRLFVFKSKTPARVARGESFKMDYHQMGEKVRVIIEQDRSFFRLLAF